MSFNYEMPRDPFADDPNDPASFLDPEEPFQPPTEEELASLHIDLMLAQRMKQLLGPRGIDGVVYLCENCEDFHYYEWDIMIDNIRSMFQGELPPVHEPGANPDPERFVPWDYGLGFLDGLDAQ